MVLSIASLSLKNLLSGVIIPVELWLLLWVSLSLLVSFCVIAGEYNEYAGLNAGLRIEKLSTGYAKREIIKELTVSLLPRGKITVLLGPNGSGKIDVVKGACWA